MYVNLYKNHSMILNDVQILISYLSNDQWDKVMWHLLTNDFHWFYVEDMDDGHMNMK